MTGKAAKVKQARKARRASRGTLVVIAVLLGLSGLIRIGSGAVHALTKEEPAVQTEGSGACTPDDGALAMLTDLRAREERLSRREGMIADRSQALNLAKAEIDKKLAALVAAEEKLAATLTLADEAADADVARLVAVYEKMKPKDAASLFSEMDPEFAAGFLARMKPDAAAQVMAGLEPKTAYTISVLLAGRNAAAPRN